VYIYIYSSFADAQNSPWASKPSHHDSWAPRLATFTGNKQLATQEASRAETESQKLRTHHSKRYPGCIDLATITLVSQVVSTLGIQHPFFLSDNQQLVNFFNRNDHNNPPRWEIKPHTALHQPYVRQQCKSFQGS